MSADEPRGPTDAVPAGARWLLPALTSGLALLAAYQLARFVPMCIYVAQRLGRRQPGAIDALATIPPELALVVALVLAALAFWHRRSVPRSALLATVAVSVNVGLQLCIFASLFGTLSNRE